jgi:hypothetical protein
MKWVGQHIYNLISRFRDDVYLERLSTTNQKSVLVVDSDGKISKNTSTVVNDYLTFTNTGNVSTLSLLSNQDTDDLFKIETTTVGATTMTTVDDGGAAANFEVAADGDITLDAAGSIALECGSGTLTSDAGDISISNASTSKPSLSMYNQADNSSGPNINFVSTRIDGGIQPGEDADTLGQIYFLGYNDGTPAIKTFASIDGTIADATTGQEAGKLELKVAEYDGTVTTGLKLDGDTNVDGRIDVTIGAGVGSKTTVTGVLVETPNTRLKLLPHNFIADDGGRPPMIDDSSIGSDELFLESNASAPLYASVEIPRGYTATHVMVYGSAVGAVEVWEMQINSKTGVSKGTGNVDTEINITDVEHDANNYLLIYVENGSGDEIHGGYVTIAIT